jgi:hypothetical protein
MAPNHNKKMAPNYKKWRQTTKKIAPNHKKNGGQNFSNADRNFFTASRNLIRFLLYGNFDSVV